MASQSQQSSAGAGRPGGAPKTAQLKVTVLEEELDVVTKRASARGTDVEVEVRRALKLKEMLDQVRQLGGSVYVQERPGGPLQEVLTG